MDVTKGILTFALQGAAWVLWLLIGLSVASLSVMLERAWYFARHRLDPDQLLADMRALLAQPAASPAASGSDDLSAVAEGAKAKVRMRFERNLVFLATVGSNAPFIGLFGTVLGIIKAFHDLAAAQATGPGVVMAGISEALVATAVGLVVAVPAVVAFNYFNRRVRTRMLEADWMAQLALARLRVDATGPSSKARAPGGAGLDAAEATEVR